MKNLLNKLGMVLGLFLLTCAGSAFGYDRHGADYIEVSDYSTYMNWGYSDQEHGDNPATALVFGSSYYERAASGDCDAFLDVGANVDYYPTATGSRYSYVGYKYTSYQEEFDLDINGETSPGGDPIPESPYGRWGSTDVMAAASDSSGFSYYEDSKSDHWY